MIKWHKNIENLDRNLMLLKHELENLIYKPKPLRRFIVRDLKTRTIHSSAFRDRVVHHALNNILEPIFEKIFILDSYANRKGKGALKALQRFDYFKRKVSCNGKKKINAFNNNDVEGFALKADIKHYFEEVNHKILLNILKRKIKDEKVMWLVKTILANHKTKTEGKGMPLGNLTSQFFANVYLNELDHFIKHKLKAKYYIIAKDTNSLKNLQSKFLVCSEMQSISDIYTKICLLLSLPWQTSKTYWFSAGLY